MSLGYEVHGLVRRVALEEPTRRFTRLEHLIERVTLHPASLESYPSIFHVLVRRIAGREAIRARVIEFYEGLVARKAPGVI